MILKLIAAAVLTIVITIAIITAILLAPKQAVELLFSGSYTRQEKVAFSAVEVGSGILIAIGVMLVVQVIISLL